MLGLQPTDEQSPCTSDLARVQPGLCTRTKRNMASRMVLEAGTRAFSGHWNAAAELVIQLPPHQDRDTPHLRCTSAQH
jgi:hypothetical protein